MTAIQKNLHDWDLTPAQAIRLQGELARQINLSPLRKKPRLVAGLDCALSDSVLSVARYQ